MQLRTWDFICQATRKESGEECKLNCVEGRLEWEARIDCFRGGMRPCGRLTTTQGKAAGKAVGRKGEIGVKAVVHAEQMSIVVFSKHLDGQNETA